MESQFQHDLYKKCFTNQVESDETDTLQQRKEWWMTVVDGAGHIPNIVHDYNFAELFYFYRKAIAPQMQEFIKAVRDREFIP